MLTIAGGIILAVVLVCVGLLVLWFVFAAFAAICNGIGALFEPRPLREPRKLKPAAKVLLVTCIVLAVFDVLIALVNV